MKANPVIAVLAASGKEEACDFENYGTLHAALALARAVLDRSGRLLLSADADHLIPLLMAAAEYQSSREVESPEENVPAPVILGPVLATDSLENQLLSYRPESLDGETSPSLLEDLLLGNLIENRSPSNHIWNSPQDFLNLLEEYDPRGIVAIGHDSELPGFLEAAERFAKRSSKRPHLFRVLAGPWGRGRSDGWEAIRAGLVDLPAPRLDGEEVAEHSENRVWDEGLIAMARNASREAAWTIELDRAVGRIFEDRETLRIR